MHEAVSSVCDIEHSWSKVYHSSAEIFYGFAVLPESLNGIPYISLAHGQNLGNVVFEHVQELAPSANQGAAKEEIRKSASCRLYIVAAIFLLKPLELAKGLPSRSCLVGVECSGPDFVLQEPRMIDSVQSVTDVLADRRIEFRLREQSCLLIELEVKDLRNV